MNRMKSVYENVFEDIENYTKEEKQKLISIFKNHICRYDWIEFMIQKVKTTLNIFKIIDVLKICVSIDLEYTRDYLEEEKLSFYYQYFFIYAILDIYHQQMNKDTLLDCLIRLKDSKVPERIDSLGK